MGTRVLTATVHLHLRRLVIQHALIFPVVRAPPSQGQAGCVDPIGQTLKALTVVKDPTQLNETYTKLVVPVRDQLNRGRVSDTPLRAGISGAAGGELRSMLHQGVKGHFEVYETDLRPGQAPDVHDIDEDGWPLDELRQRIAVGCTDVALARNCF